MKTSMNTPLSVITRALAVCLASFTLNASAHQLWVGVNNFLPVFPAAGGPATVHLYTTFGHRLPIDEVIEDERFGGVYLQADGAAAVPVTTTADGFRSAQLRLDKPGAYLLLTANKPVFSTQVRNAGGPVAYVRAAKNAVPAGATVVDSTLIHNFAKTLVYLAGEGAAEAVVTRPVGHTIEIVPQRNPATLAKGAALGLQIYYRGRPYSGDPIEVTADHEGGAAAGKALWSGLTDRSGRIEVPLGEAGIWQLVATRVEPATGELADRTNQSRFRASFTFEVPGAVRRQ